MWVTLTKSPPDLWRALAKALGLTCLAAALAAPAAAAEPVPSGLALGTVEALLQYCARVDPASAARYQQLGQLLAQGADEESLAAVRQSEDYRQSYDATTEQVREVGDEATRQTCAQSAAAAK